LSGRSRNDPLILAGGRSAGRSETTTRVVSVAAGGISMIGWDRLGWSVRDWSVGMVAGFGCYAASTALTPRGAGRSASTASLLECLRRRARTKQVTTTAAPEAASTG
jgi:hypothetical protein